VRPVLWLSLVNALLCTVLPGVRDDEWPVARIWCRLVALAGMIARCRDRARLRVPRRPVSGWQVVRHALVLAARVSSVPQGGPVHNREQDQPGKLQMKGQSDRRFRSRRPRRC